MRVLVTGGTGLIGASVVARLLAAGHEIVAVARGVARAARSQPAVRWVALLSGAAAGSASAPPWVFRPSISSPGR